MSDIKFDVQNQLDRVQPFIVAGETLKAVFDCKGGGTGFVGVSDQRVIFFDEGRLTRHKELVTIPFNRVIGIGLAEAGVMMKSSIITLITAAGKFDFEFRGHDKAVWLYQYITHQLLSQANPQLPR